MFLREKTKVVSLMLILFIISAMLPFNKLSIPVFADNVKQPVSSDGGSWSVVRGPSDSYADLTDIAFVDIFHAWAVGDRGTILFSNSGGVTWVSQSSNTDNILFGVTFINNQIGWAVGGAGTILKTTNGGQIWSKQDSKTAVLLRDVSFADANNGWVVGDGGTILHTVDGGNTWQKIVDSNLQQIYDVKTLDTLTAYAVTTGGYLLKTFDGGNSWGAFYEPLSTAMLSIEFIDPLHGWISGDGGHIAHTEDGGISWSGQSSSTVNQLIAIDFVDPQTGWVVGQNGFIMNTTDGGDHWQTQLSGVSQYLLGVSFIDADFGVAVGSKGVILTHQPSTWARWELSIFDIKPSTLPSDGGLVTVAVDTMAYGVTLSPINFTMTGPSYNETEIAVNSGGSCHGWYSSIRWSASFNLPANQTTSDQIYTVTASSSQIIGTRTGQVIVQGQTPSPNIELTLYSISDNLGDKDTSNPGTSNATFYGGQTVRVTLKARNTGTASVDANWVLNLATSSNHSDLRYNSDQTANNTNDKTIPNDSQWHYYSFDWVVIADAPLGTYDILASIRRADDWDKVLDTTASGANDTDWENAWLTNQFEVQITIPLNEFPDVEDDVFVKGMAISGYGGLEVSFTLKNNTANFIADFFPEIRISSDMIWDLGDTILWGPTEEKWEMSLSSGTMQRISNIVRIPASIPNGSNVYILMSSVRRDSSGYIFHGPVRSALLTVEDELLIIPAIKPKDGDILIKDGFNSQITWWLSNLEDGKLIVQPADYSDALLRNQMANYVPGHAGLVVPVDIVPESYKAQVTDPNIGIWVFESVADFPNPGGPILNIMPTLKTLVAQITT